MKKANLKIVLCSLLVSVVVPAHAIDLGIRWESPAKAFDRVKKQAEQVVQDVGQIAGVTVIAQNPVVAVVVMKEKKKQREEEQEKRIKQAEYQAEKDVKEYKEKKMDEVLFELQLKESDQQDEISLLEENLSTITYLSNQFIAAIEVNSKGHDARRHFQQMSSETQRVLSELIEILINANGLLANEQLASVKNILDIAEFERLQVLDIFESIQPLLTKSNKIKIVNDWTNMEEYLQDFIWTKKELLQLTQEKISEFQKK